MDPNPAKHIPVADRRERVRDIAPEIRLHSILETLLRRMPGVEWVEITHGSDEYGKDLVVCSRTTFGADYVGVVVKLGKISGAAAGTQTLTTVKRQVEQAAKMPWASLRLKREVHINRILVVCTDTISGNARTEILKTAPTDYVNIEFWSGQQLEEHLYAHFPEFFVDVDPTVANYLQRFCDTHSDLSADHRRFGTHKSRSLPDVFVEPRLIFFDEYGRKELHARARLGPTKVVLDHLSVPSTLDSRILQDPKENIFVMGPPGCGKSSALKKAAIDLAKRHYGGAKDAPLPLFVAARRLLESMDSTKAAESFFRSMPLCSQFSEKGLHKYLQENVAILYVDGMDEVAHRESDVLDFLIEISSLYPKLKIVCSTRLAYFSKPKELPGFRQALMLPMNMRGVQHLIERILGKGKRSTQMLRAIVERDLHRALPQTPLVFTILALLHEQERMEEIPANIADLYDMVIQVDLGRWSPGRWGRPGTEEYAVQVEILKHIAYEMHMARSTTILRDQFEDKAREYLLARGYTRHATQIVDSLLNNSAILGCLAVGDSGQAKVSFAHLSFQEFLVARRLDDVRDSLPSLAQRFSDDWWGNVLVFYAGLRKDVPDLLEAIFTAGTPTHPLGALAVSLQVGLLLQAASQSPVSVKERGCLYGTDLVQFFFAEYAKQQDERHVPFRFTKTQLMFALALLYSLSYGSQHLADAMQGAFQKLIIEFTGASGDQRLLLGIRAICAAAALAERGDWSGIELFVEAAKSSDFALLQSAATMLELLASPDAEVDERWMRAVRMIRRFAPKGGVDALRRADKSLKALKTPPQLQDSTLTASTDAPSDVAETGLIAPSGSETDGT